MLEFAIRLGKKAGDYLQEHLVRAVEVEFKGPRDLVTGIDRGSQALIVEEIERSFPDHAILAEEGLRKETGSSFTWIVDPLDGTVNYVHRIPFFCVSLALYKDGLPYIGVCYNPVSGELFRAQAGGGAYLNDERISVSPNARLVDALVVTGFPYAHDTIDAILAKFGRVIRATRAVRRFGSAALDLCHVAKGSFDAFWEMGLKPWDMAAGVVVLLEAGGKVTSLDGSPFDLFSGDILASNARVHDELVRLM
ncbi:MAG TPA: inositol monophosphatase family protein [Deltaproteobacteria bacterium]|nr:inositol monophosphatase family protein [Deltaproteobacteria bacterium]